MSDQLKLWPKSEPPPVPPVPDRCRWIRYTNRRHEEFFVPQCMGGATGGFECCTCDAEELASERLAAERARAQHAEDEVERLTWVLWQEKRRVNKLRRVLRAEMKHRMEST